MSWLGRLGLDKASEITKQAVYYGNVCWCFGRMKMQLHQCYETVV